MTLPVECPHCNSVFQLGPDLVGKSMRCPNPDCRGVFRVEPQAAAPPREPDPITPLETPDVPRSAGGVTDFVEVLEAEPADPVAPLPFERIESDGYGPPAIDAEVVAEPSVFELPAPDPVGRPRLSLDKPPRKRPPTNVPFAAFAPKAMTAAPVPAPPVPAAKTAGPREVAWTADPPPAAPAARPLPASDADDGVFERKARKSRWPVVAAVALTVGVVGVFGFIGYGFVTIGERTETQLAADAKAAYDAGKFGEAAETYRKVGDEYPGSANVDEYYFLAALSDARAAADSVTAREEPAPSRAKLAEFLAVYADSPYARPDVTFGTDVAALGRKVADNFADHGTDRLAKFRTDRTKPESLEAAERAAADGPPLLASLETFRGKDTPGFDDLRKKFDAVADAARKERDRLAVLAPFRTLADDPTDEAIETAEAKFRQTGLANDAEAKAIIAHAKERLRQLIGAVPDARAATRVPADLTPPVLFVAAPLGSPDPRVAPDAVPDVVFAVARGVLYALDADSGRPLWGTRVGGLTGDPRAADLPVRVTVSEGGPEWVLVAAEVNGRRGLAARVARTGEPVWYQPLDAPLAGRPAVVGRRVYVPLADPLGTVEEFQLTTGMRVGHLAIRQPVGGGLAALSGLQSGSGFLFVPADARRVFVFEVGREADDGTREPPRCVRVIATGHPRDSLRGEPVLVSPPAGDGPRYLILPQTDGPAAMKLRCFTLPSPTEMAVEGGPEADGTGPVAPVAEVTIPGWSWFPPAADGERVVAATDAGAVAVFGVNQAGNADKALFALPAPDPATDPTADASAVNRAQVAAVDEDSAWVVVGGQLTRLRTAVSPAGGLRVVPDGRSETVGEPIHRAQVRAGSGLAVVVTKAGSAAGRATAFDLHTGQIRWQRQLGAVAAAAPIVRAGRPAVVAGEAGGVYAVPTAEPDAAAFAAVLAAPLRDTLTPALVARSADGATVWVLILETIDGGKRLRVRQISDGVARSDVTPTLPDLPAGPPVSFGDTFLLPLRDGAVYRYEPANGLVKGPLWRAGANPDAACFLAAAGPDEFLCTDGADAETAVARWAWPAAGTARKRGGGWRSAGTISAPPAVLATGAGFRFAVASTSGVVRLFEPGKQDEPEMQWRGAEGGDIPPGSAGTRLEVIAVGGKSRIVYAAGGRAVVCLDPDAETPAWVVRGLVADDGTEVVGWATHGRRLLVTDQTAHVTAIDLETGERLPDVAVGVAGLAARKALPVAADRGLLTLFDGTAVVFPLPTAKTEKP